MKWAHVYLSRSCPHCKDMQTNTLEALGDLGFLVPRTYLDTVPQDAETGEYVNPVVRAITTVPTTFIYDSSMPLGKPVMREGTLTVEELKTALGV